MNHLDTQNGADTRRTHTHDARRRLLRGAAIAGPVVLTLVSKPVLGANCISPSRTLSGNLSQIGNNIGNCSGKGITLWRGTDTSAWPINKSTKFNNEFPAGLGANTKFLKSNGNKQNFSDVLALSSTNTDYKMAQHFIVALMNIRAGTVAASALDETRLKQMWAEYATSGKYQPFAGGTSWYLNDIINYFISNNIAPN